jgi:photosystem II stability/assembly factor-like uncharacterized protein
MKLHPVRVALATLLVLTAGLLFVGRAGALSTGNGGWQWQNPLPHGAAYNGMYFSTAQRGWLLTNTCILKTTDGGATVTVQSNHNVQFKDITFFGSKRGWVVGWPLDPGKDRVVIYRTTNGGASWTNVPLNVKGWLNAVCFVNKNVGWAVGGKGSTGGGGAGLVLKTVNGGVTWTQQSASGGAELNDVSMISATRGWTVASMGKVWRTTNGVTWKRVGPELNETPHAVHFQSAQTGWVAGWGKIWRTNNGGISWTTQLDLGLYNSQLTAMDFADAQHGWVVGDDGVTYGTTDGGVHWTSQGTPDRLSLACVDAVSAGTVVVAGYGGRIGHSATGGASWTWLPTAASGYLGNLNAVDFTDANNGWIAAGQSSSGGLPANAGIFHTRDGGATWTWQNPAVMAPLNDIDMIDAASGWAVGDVGAIVHWNGANWAAQASGTAADLQAVSFLDASNGWAVGSDYNPSAYNSGGIVRHTTNGGVT